MPRPCSPDTEISGPRRSTERVNSWDRIGLKTARTLGTFALALVAYTAAAPARDELISWVTPDSEQETAIEKELEKALYVDVRVDCVTEAREVFASLVFDSYDKGVRGWNNSHSAHRASKTLHLMQDVCDSFMGFTTSVENHQPISYLQNEAVNIATHETMHASGIANEAEANCYAIQRSEITALSLGASASEALETRRVAAQLTSPTLPPKYQSDECRAGGAYDLGSNPNGVFPEN